mmetsp:Transcript_30166/g.39742  ORF Transcript_30166/g.39742 Transcript_30166/m.39742 type:complete len:1367 (-) Transcript_30166:180-4280(-)
MTKTVYDKEKGSQRLPNPYDEAGFFSRLIFSWIFAVLRVGSKKDLSDDDLPNLATPEQSSPLVAKLQKAWDSQTAKAQSSGGQVQPPSLLKALVEVFGALSFRMLIFLALNSAVKVAQTIFLGRLVGYFSDEDAPFSTGLLWAGVLTGTAWVENIMHHHFYFWSWRLGLQLRVGTSALLYAKCLKLKLGSLGQVTMGYIINLATNDIERFQLAGIFVLYFITAPLLALAVLYLGFMQIGISFLAGWGCLILLIPCQMKLGKLFGATRRSVAVKTDKRVKLTNQAVGGARLMKLSGWEHHFMDSINNARSDECKGIFKANYLRAFNETLFFITPSLLALVTFLTYNALGNTLTPQKVFTVIALLNLIQFELTKFLALAIQSCSEAWVSLKRLEQFLNLEEVGQSRQLQDGMKMNNPEEDAGSKAPTQSLNIKSSRVKMKSASFRWNGDGVDNQNLNGKKKTGGNLKAKSSEESKQEEAPLILKDLDFEIQDGQLFAFVGPVGSAKSSLLMAVLNEMNFEDERGGEVQVHGRIAYASQEPWIVSGTIRHNILFGKEFEQARYDQVVESCSLLTDFAAFQKGDMTIIGDRGVNLSGGQKARVGLARLAYANDADIYLMDDPLSAVDPAVGKHLFEEVICKLLANKTRILVTHQLQYLQHPAVDNICVLEQGKLKDQGKFTELVGKGLISSEYLHEKQQEEDSEMRTDRPELNADHGEEQDRRASFSMIRTAEASMAISEVDVKDKKDETKEEFKGIVTDEEKESGMVQWSTYREYIREMGGFSAFFFVLLLLASAQGLVMYASAFLAEWSEMDAEEQQNPKHASFYALLVGLSTFLAIARSTGCFTLLILASKRMHGRMLNRILRAPVGFFDANPIGRIMNRFSKDLGLMDDLLAYTIYDFLQCFFIVAGSVLFVCFVNPWIFLIFPLLVGLFIVIRNFSQQSSRELKRLEAVSRSPIYSLISETLDGITTIRAFGQQPRFMEDFFKKMDCNSRSYFLWLAVCRWLGYWLDMLVVLMIGGTAFISVVINETFSEISGGLLGAGLTYVVLLAGLFQWAVRQSAEAENQMISVERVLDYCRVPQEAPLLSRSEVKPPEEWPERGSIKAVNLTARYHEKLPPVLKGLSFEIKGGQRIGIVGRTGAGKSSFVSVLFRLIESMPGSKLEIDGSDISELGLHDLRLKMSVIPQTPFLFSGTIKENLDPFNRIENENEMWEALEAVQMAAPIRQLPKRLEALVAESGGNWSVGQRQLLCLARALLARNRILVMDEATANIDLETDNLIQQAVRTKFKGCTVIMIAHRLHTVIDCDKILVLGSGKVIEYASPHELLQNKKNPIPTNSFLSMVNETGSQTSAELKRLAEQYYELSSKK